MIIHRPPLSRRLLSIGRSSSAVFNCAWRPFNANDAIQPIDWTEGPCPKGGTAPKGLLLLVMADFLRTAR
jgi:hypothetical protein